MTIEVHFTPKKTGLEIPFTIATGKAEKEIFLYSLYENIELKYKLESIEGSLKLIEENPFEESDEIVSERLIGLSADWLENKSQGFESSADFNNIKKPGYGPDDIFVENKPFSLKQIVDLIENKDIELTPDFQRNFIWDKTRQSKLIESILLGLPLPSIYLSQYEDGRLTVVDGLQRLTTIKRFLDDELKLSNLEYLTNCNGKYYKDLEGILSPLRLRRFGQTQVMCFVIDYRSPSQLKFDLFRRLNTGGKPLNNQEIRNCLSRPSVQLVLKRMVDNESFLLATDHSVRDTRMEAREAALRFIYFSQKYSFQFPAGDYSGDMESSLDGFIDLLNEEETQNLEKYIELYEKGLKNSYHLFGEFCFRKIVISNLSGKRTPVNKLVMLTMTILLCGYDDKEISKLNEYKSLVIPLSILIESDNNLYDALTYGTNGKKNIETAFKIFQIFLDENLITF